jgi:cobalt-zinc-cadmium efflux system outer membrane protein
MRRNIYTRLGLVACACILISGSADAQGPTIGAEEPASPGSDTPLLGPSPGSGGGGSGEDPGSSESLLGGRPGSSTPRVPSSVSTPGATAGPTDAQTGITGPRPLPIGRVPLYGTLEIPAEADEGPPNALTLDQAIGLLLRENLELRAQFIELPLAEADILTASLRANPILYADSQLIPYGKFTADRPGGQTQYDVNISYPLDVSRKRRARTQVAVAAKRVLEAQYQDAARRSIDNLYTAYVDVLAARQNVRYALASVEGLGKVLLVTQRLYEKDQTNRADVNRVKVQVDSARIGLADAEESLRRSRRILGGLLNLPPLESETLEVRGAIRDPGVVPPPIDEMLGVALAARPDLVSYRLGVGRAQADVRLALANRFADVYVLYQPYTFQDNAPLGLKSAHSWALGVTLPLPIYNRNQGGIQRAKLNVTQTRVELAAIERQVITEVRQAEAQYAVTRDAVGRIRDDLLPSARQVRDDTYRLYTAGEVNVVVYLDAQRDYNDVVKQYLDAAVRHRRSTLALNTAVGQRILP